MEYNRFFEVGAAPIAKLTDPFGASKAAKIFHRLSQPITRIMRRKGYTVIAYLDNFLLEPSLQGFNTSIELLQNLGFSINWGKVINPFQWLIFLGVEIDTILRRLILPQQKMAEIHEILQFSVSKDKLTKREFQCVIGQLNFASHMIYGGRTFLKADFLS